MPDTMPVSSVTRETDLVTWSSDDLLAVLRDATNLRDDATLNAAGYLMKEACGRRLDIGYDVIARFAPFSGLGAWAVRAAAWCADSRVVDLLRKKLVLPKGSTEVDRMAVMAAQSLGHLRAREAAEEMLHLIPHLTGNEQALVIVAVEQAGDGSLAREFQALLADASDHNVFWLVRALRRWTGHSPAWPAAKTWQESMAIVRRQWGAIDLGQPPMPSAEFSITCETQASVSVVDGRDLLSLEGDEPNANCGWPEPSVSWTQFGHSLYRVGWNVCETCMVYLEQVGWSPSEAAELAQAARGALADVKRLSSPL
ncbi:MAG: hypothetical protein LBN10_03800, partial [Propionibacteriaceae bacterium]|nr:hypothetical protein [Propionibacteriaceae bacterium]